MHTFPFGNRCLLFHYTCFSKNGKKSRMQSPPGFGTSTTSWCIMLARSLSLTRDGRVFTLLRQDDNYEWYHCNDENVGKSRISWSSKTKINTTSSDFRDSDRHSGLTFEAYERRGMRCRTTGTLGSSVYAAMQLLLAAKRLAFGTLNANGPS